MLACSVFLVYYFFKKYTNKFKLKSEKRSKLENILKDSGRGIHIMKSFVDNLHYNFTSKGTEAILEINLK